MLVGNTVLVWCAYCQKFIGEDPPYEELRLTHGICPSCEAAEAELTDQNFEKARALGDIVARLFDAGRAGNLLAAEHIVEEASAAGIRAADILIGMLAPLMFVIGESWGKGAITVEQQQHFSAFCEEAYQLVAAKTRLSQAGTETLTGRPTVLIMNAPGNFHTLGIRVLALWLADRNANVCVVDPPLDAEGLAMLVRETHAKFLLVSMAIPEQETHIFPIVERLTQLPEAIRPQIFVGGNAVKMGLVPAIPGATLLTDISLFPNDLSGRPGDGMLQPR